MPDWLINLILGIVEGITEFIPVSSTGHLILLVDLLGFQGPPGKVFEIVVQLGAILAILAIYWRTLLDVLLRAPSDPGARRFILAVLLAFLPAAVIGAVAHGFIKSILFSPWVVSVALTKARQLGFKVAACALTLIVGGIAILWIERLHHASVHNRIEDFSPGLALRIGCFQVLAMVPGVSRSGATIMGALLMGVERKTATLFSFFLAIPTMLGATVYDIYKNRHSLDLDGTAVIAVGFIVAFLSALLVVRWLVGFVGRHGFGVFAWYRIVVGVTMLGVLFSR